ncbi:hypothetical protein Tco_0748361 [Tanacetum coccineum]|uniref:Retrovirus-related Pol polyprotein from transposon TNT 1-94-like beta-barrel domain-containing protein n=1 Tax=Tanacetum coccineum TaxID=301880 RepID=A0ABQ4YY66_9ASTR
MGTLKNKGIIDSGCSRHMTGNKAYLADFQDFNGGPVAFGGSKGYITGKGKIKTGKLDFEDVSFVKELQHFNLFSVSQMCDKKNKVNQDSTQNAGTKDARDSEREDASNQDCFELPIWHSYSSTNSSASKSDNERGKDLEALEDESWVDAMPRRIVQFEIKKFGILVDFPLLEKGLSVTKWVPRPSHDIKVVKVDVSTCTVLLMLSLFL